jgi:hypothetical protein
VSEQRVKVRLSVRAHYTFTGLLVLGIISALTPTPARAELTWEAFNNFGTQPLILANHGLGGGEGWGGNWVGYDNTSNIYQSGLNVSISTPGYNNSINQTDSNDGVAAFRSVDPNMRAFDSSYQGDIWISILVFVGDNRFYRGVTFGRSWLPVDMFGIESSGHAWIDTGTGRVYGVLAPFMTPTHMLVNLKTDPVGPDSISLWINPADLTNGVAGLGAPGISVANTNFIGSLGNLTMLIGGGTLVDDIRISHGNLSSSAKIMEIAQGVSLGSHITVPAGSNTNAAGLGGSGQVGGVNVNLGTTGGGNLDVDYESMTQQEFFDRLSRGEFPFNNFNFGISSSKLMLWNIDYDGTYTSPVEITLGYDPAAVANPSQLRIFHNHAGFWETIVPTSFDESLHTVTFRTNTLSPFVVSEVPEPASLGILGIGALALMRRQR